MKRIAIAALAAALLAGVTPALAKEDCNGGYKTFLGKMIAGTWTESMMNSERAGPTSANMNIATALVRANGAGCWSADESPRAEPMVVPRGSAACVSTLRWGKKTSASCAS